MKFKTFKHPILIVPGSTPERIFLNINLDDWVISFGYLKVKCYNKNYSRNSVSAANYFSIKFHTYLSLEAGTTCPFEDAVPRHYLTPLSRIKVI
jgi:hypothetical protein